MKVSLILVSLILCFGACNPGQSGEDKTNLANEINEHTKPTVENINKKELVNLIEADTTVQLVDVRTLEETREGTIEDAITEMDFLSGQFESKINELDKNKPVILYCASGRRSAEAAQMLIENDFNKVYNYMGGYNEWSNQ